MFFQYYSPALRVIIKSRDKKYQERREGQKMLTRNEKIDRGKGIAAMLMGPVAGLVYFICLPIIAIGTVVTSLGRKITVGIINRTGNLASFGWRPTEAYLEGKKKKRRRE
jgi:hypothetical protein